MKIAVLDDYGDYSTKFAQWGDLADCVTVFREPIAAEELVTELHSFGVLCVMRERTPLTAELIEALPNLRLIVTTGMRNNSIDMAAARARGITVCGTASRTSATAHLTFTLIMVATRNLLPEIRSLNAGGWQTQAGRDLDGLTLGLIGLGRLGSAVAELARPFGMKMVAWSENLTADRCAEVGVGKAASLDDLLSVADVASIHLVLSERTRGLIGAPELARMKRNSVLVNTSRAQIVDEEALLSALRAGRPARAALDVFTQEPLSADATIRDAELLAAGNLILTPHIGYGSLETYRLMYAQTAENVRAWTEGSPIREI